MFSLLGKISIYPLPWGRENSHNYYTRDGGTHQKDSFGHGISTFWPLKDTIFMPDHLRLPIQYKCVFSSKQVHYIMTTCKYWCLVLNSLIVSRIHTLQPLVRYSASLYYQSINLTRVWQHLSAHGVDFRTFLLVHFLTLSKIFRHVATLLDIYKCSKKGNSVPRACILSDQQLGNSMALS